MKSQMFKILKVLNNALRSFKLRFCFSPLDCFSREILRSFSSNLKRVSFDLKCPVFSVSDPFILKTKYMATPRQSTVGTLVFDLLSSHPTTPLRV